MPEKLYVYAVARIRSKEMQLLDTQFINQLMAAPGYRECLKLLMEKGGKEGCTELEQILTYEQQKTWAFISELVEDMSVFNVLLLPNDYHNLKAAIKTVYTGLEDENLFYPGVPLMLKPFWKQLRLRIIPCCLSICVLLPGKPTGINADR